MATFGIFFTIALVIFIAWIIKYYLLSNMSTPAKKHQKQNNQNIELFKKLKDLEERLAIAEAKNKQLEYRMTKVESTNKILSKVNAELSKEVDRLDQYHRRSNVILKNMILPEEEQIPTLSKKVTKVLKDDLSISDSILNDIDKLHRVGKIKKNKKGKNTQDIIIRFKSHFARYTVMEKRKELQNLKICPNLTHKRGKLWYDASQRVATIPQINFVFADIHGDLKIRLHNEFGNRSVFNFSTMEELEALMLDMGFITDE